MDTEEIIHLRTYPRILPAVEDAQDGCMVYAANIYFGVRIFNSM